VVVECGSGVSSLIIGYALQRNGGGKLWALEHEEWGVRTTTSWLEHHQLANHAEVIHAPLNSFT
jgi:predicted O-methyltransferase YrrM